MFTAVAMLDEGRYFWALGETRDAALGALAEDACDWIERSYGRRDAVSWMNSSLESVVVMERGDQYAIQDAVMYGDGETLGEGEFEAFRGLVETVWSMAEEVAR